MLEPALAEPGAARISRKPWGLARPRYGNRCLHRQEDV